MNTGTLNWIRQLLVHAMENLRKAKLPKDYPEWRRESQIGLFEVTIAEVDQEIESNRKRSERTKRCMRKKSVQL